MTAECGMTAAGQENPSGLRAFCDSPADPEGSSCAEGTPYDNINRSSAPRKGGSPGRRGGRDGMFPDEPTQEGGAR